MVWMRMVHTQHHQTLLVCLCLSVQIILRREQVAVTARLVFACVGQVQDGRDLSVHPLPAAQQQAGALLWVSGFAVLVDLAESF
jgi:hypothetical protein